MVRLRGTRRLVLVCLVIALIAMFTPVAMAGHAPDRGMYMSCVKRPRPLITGHAPDKGMYR